MKVLFDYCFDQDDVHYFKLVLNYSLAYPGEYLKDFSDKISKILKEFEDRDWLFDCLPDKEEEPRVLDFLFSKEELHVIALCADNYRTLDVEHSLRVRCHVLTSLLWTFFN